MKSFRNPKYIERYEDVFFQLETPLNTGNPGNNRSQKKDGYRFVVDNTGEVTPFDWYNARISVGFKVQTMANANLVANDENNIVNGSYSLIHDLDIRLNGKHVYDCNDANHCVNIKNLLEYSPGYAQSTATNEFFYLDTFREPRTQEAAVSAGAKKRKALLGTSVVVNTEIPLNRYAFFEALRDELLPSTRLELNSEIESDDNLIWRTGGAACRVMITRMELIVPRITFNSEGQSLYMNQFLKLHKWVYLRENVEKSNSSTQRSGNFQITSSISKPRHVFVFIINDANIGAQTANPFLYNTFSVSTDPRTLLNCHLSVANGNEYPDVHYTPEADLTRVYRDVLKYVHANNEYSQGTLLNINNFKTLFPFLYFDLTKQKMDIKDGTTKLTFHYELSGTTATAYSVYALTLYEQDAELIQKDGKILFREME